MGYLTSKVVFGGPLSFGKQFALGNRSISAKM